MLATLISWMSEGEKSRAALGCNTRAQTITRSRPHHPPDRRRPKRLNIVAVLPRCMSPLMARRDQSRCCETLVANGGIADIRKRQSRKPRSLVTRRRLWPKIISSTASVCGGGSIDIDERAAIDRQCNAGNEVCFVGCKEQSSVRDVPGSAHLAA